MKKHLKLWQSESQHEDYIDSTAFTYHYVCLVKDDYNVHYDPKESSTSYTFSNMEYDAVVPASATSNDISWDYSMTARTRSGREIVTTGSDDYTATFSENVTDSAKTINGEIVRYDATAEYEFTQEGVIKVTGVTLNKSTLSLSEGDTDTLVATVLPNDASNKNVIWRSSNESVATVDSNGVVSGVSIGNADITVTTEYGGFTAQCSVSINSNKVITYAASAKLSETTSTSTTGLHTNAFSGTSGQQLTIVSHTFEDGVGTITFNDTIKTVGNYAFYYCTGLTSINIPDSVTNIGGNAFGCCSGLTSIDIPSGVTSIDYGAFSSCSGLTSIDIPDSVTSIGHSTFAYCTSLTSVTIPNSVTSIGDSTFYNCSGLTSCTIGSGVTSIGNNAFDGCKGLTSIDIPSGVTSIGTRAFEYCYSLRTVTIGDSVTSIGGGAFYGCSGLTSIVSNAATAPTIQSSTFQSIKTGGTLIVPIGSSGYDVWMGTSNYYLGLYNWTKVEQ